MHSPYHATNIALVLNTQTGLVTPQFHCLFDDDFATCKRDRKFSSIWQRKAKLHTTKPQWFVLTPDTVPVIPPSLSVPWIPDLQVIPMPTPDPGLPTSINVPSGAGSVQTTSQTQFDPGTNLPTVPEDVAPPDAGPLPMTEMTETNVEPRVTQWGHTVRLPSRYAHVANDEIFASGNEELLQPSYKEEPRPLQMPKKVCSHLCGFFFWPWYDDIRRTNEASWTRTIYSSNDERTLGSREPGTF